MARGSERGRLSMRRAAVGVAAVLVAASVIVAAAPSLTRSASGSRIPARPAGALTGSEFACAAAALTGAEFQAAATAEILAGNVPDFLRSFRPVHLSWQDSGGGRHEALIEVSPDYLAIGSDRDFLRVPLALEPALAVAGAFGCLLPTSKMVDAIYEQADCRLEPEPLPPGPAMVTCPVFEEHQKRVEARRLRTGCPLGALTGGNKKDVVLTPRLARNPGRIAIYGWHRASGRPIQPLSTVHTAAYADYSHGIRLVAATAWIDGRPQPVLEVLRDPTLAPLLSSEGVIRQGT